MYYFAVVIVYKFQISPPPKQGLNKPLCLERLYGNIFLNSLYMYRVVCPNFGHPALTTSLTK